MVRMLISSLYSYFHMKDHLMRLSDIQILHDGIYLLRFSLLAATADGKNLIHGNVSNTKIFSIHKYFRSYVQYFQSWRTSRQITCWQGTL